MVGRRVLSPRVGEREGEAKIRRVPERLLRVRVTCSPPPPPLGVSAFVCAEEDGMFRFGKHEIVLSWICPTRSRPSQSAVLGPPAQCPHPHRRQSLLARPSSHPPLPYRLPRRVYTVPRLCTSSSPPLRDSAQSDASRSRFVDLSSAHFPKPSGPDASTFCGIDTFSHHGRRRFASPSLNKRPRSHQWHAQWQWRSSRRHIRARHFLRPLSLSFISPLSPSPHSRSPPRGSGIHLR